MKRGNLWPACWNSPYTRLLHATLRSVVLLSLLLATPASAERGIGRRDRGFAEIYQRWLSTTDELQGLALAEQLLNLEPIVTAWPLEQPRRVVKAQLWYYVGYAYQNRQAGEAGSNQERAVEAYTRALQFYDAKRFPHDRAEVYVQRARAHRTRLKGAAVTNLEAAIEDLQAAVALLTRGQFPAERARAEIALGQAYLDLPGERKDHIERAIASLVDAVHLLDRGRDAEDWAAANGTLGIAYRIRLTGLRSKNLEDAITALTVATQVFSRQSSPDQWAQAQNNLGNAYAERIQGSRADNLEMAIASFDASLAARSRERYPQEWAQTQNNLAIAYRNRLRGKRSYNITQAINAYELALTVRTKESSPELWARTLSNMAVAYLEDAGRGGNFERALQACRDALSVLTRDAAPVAWAQTQNTLALAYIARVVGSKEENTQNAIAAAQQALTVFHRDRFEQDWAENQYAIGLAVANAPAAGSDLRALGITALERALEVFTKGAFPRLHLRTARQLGRVLIANRDWQAARHAYEGARDAFFVLFGEGLEEVEAQSVIADAGPLFAEAALAAIETGHMAEAFDLAHEGRAHLLTVALRLQTLKLTAYARGQLERLRVQIRAEEAHAADAELGSRRLEIIANLAAQRAELLALIRAGTESGKDTAFARAHKLVAGGGAVSVPVLGDSASKILLVVRTQDAPIVLDLPELTNARLQALMRGDGSIGKAGGWLGAYRINYLASLSRLLKWPEWEDAIAALSGQLWSRFGERLSLALREHGVQVGERLIWLPTGPLGLLPLGLVGPGDAQPTLIDSFEIVYSPNLDLFSNRENENFSLAAVINPTGDLTEAVKEGAMVASFFPPEQRVSLVGSDATLASTITSLKGRTHWHFATHGEFAWDDARDSALLLHNDEKLSIKRLLDTEKLGTPRLVVLSACETGLYDIDRNADEFVGLPSTFVSLGAAGVVASLWPVGDEPTSLLMAKFYQLHTSGASPSAALRSAQMWLKSATKAQVDSFANELVARGAGNLRPSDNRHMRIKGAPDLPASTDNAEHPFAHPFYWAGFVYTGQ